MFFKSNRIQTQKIHIIRYEHDNIGGDDDDIDDDDMKQIMRDIDISRTLI